jgi:AraC-like DNA-binding protein
MARARLTTSIAEHGEWLMADAPPAPELAGLVRGYTGFVERSDAPLRRLEPPSGTAVLIVSFGAPFDVSAPGRPVTTHGESFIGRVSQLPATVEFVGTSAGIQVDFMPLGVQMFCGLPMDEVPDPAVGLGDLFGAEGALLTELLAGAPDWDTRFDLLDTAILRRYAQAPEPPAGVAWAWRTLELSGGRARVGDLSERLGWTPRRLIDGFRAHVGVTPKTAGRILRFHRATGLLRAADARTPIARIASECGYADQAHMNREFRDFAGKTPASYRKATLPGYLGIPADA